MMIKTLAWHQRKVSSTASNKYITLHIHISPLASFSGLPTNPVLWLLVVCRNGGGKAWSILSCGGEERGAHHKKQAWGLILVKWKCTTPGSKWRTCAWNAFFWPDPHPPVYQSRHNVIHVIKWTKLSPSISATLQAIKNWMVGRPGNKLHYFQAETILPAIHSLLLFFSSNVAESLLQRECTECINSYYQQC